MSHCHYTPSRRIMSMAELNHNKTLNIRLADHLESLGIEYNDHRILNQAHRVRHCSTFWNGFYCESCGKFHGMHTTGCKHRLCPICATRQARVTAMQAVEAIEHMKRVNSDLQMSLLTLTQKNVPGSELKREVSFMLKGWAAITNRLPMRRLIGWARTIEIVPALAGDGTYHPHIHAIIVHNPSECPSVEWIVKAWGEAMNLNYQPVCDLRPIVDEQGAVFEVSKYISKMTRVYDGSIHEHDHVRFMSEAMSSRRLRSYGGEWRKARLALNMMQAEDMPDDAIDEYESNILSDDCPSCGKATVPACLRWAGLRYVGIDDQIRVIPMNWADAGGVWNDSSQS